MLDNIIEIGMLYDFYGDLLPQKQKEIFGLYYDDNLSLGEISEEYGLTRQGIHETIKRGEKKLREYEAKLGLIAKYKAEEKSINVLGSEIDRIIQLRKDDRELVKQLGILKGAVSELNKQ
ncbi:putative DNA-binding protein [Bacillota bacterium]